MVNPKPLSLHPISQSPAESALPLQWSLTLWGDHIPGYTSADWVNFYENAKHANYQKWSGAGQELIYIGSQEGQVVGAIALVDFDDLEEFRHLTPWIAGFIVDPKRRGQGQGEQMLTLLEREAFQLGIKVLYLWTEDRQDFYKKRGYKFLQNGSLEELTFTILSKELTS